MAGRDRGRPGSKRSGSSTRREATVRLKTAKGRKPSSTRWLRRQLNDPYVIAAGRHGYRSRAAWKLVEIDEKFRLLRGAAAVLDLGAAPGGWTQVAVERARRGGRVVAVDLVEMDPVNGAETLVADLDDEDAAARLLAAFPDGVDLVLSDMAISATGHRGTDQIRNQRLAEIAYDLAGRILAPGASLVIKAFHGGGASALMASLKRDFAEVRTFKPAASRSESAEVYVVARKFRRRDAV